MQIQIASIFLVGCPACNRNFKHFYCLLTCSPDQVRGGCTCKKALPLWRLGLGLGLGLGLFSAQAAGRPFCEGRDSPIYAGLNPFSQPASAEGPPGFTLLLPFRSRIA